MVNLPFDFGVIIAYLVPGLIVLRGLSPHIPLIESQFLQLGPQGRPIAPLFSLAVAAMVAGMILSLVRFATIDASFAWPWGSAEGVWGALERVDPNYAALAESGRLGAFLEAKMNDLRPYQFYGNTLLAAVVVLLSKVAATVASPRKSSSALLTRIGLWLLALIAAAVLLYPASRLSYYRFNQAVRALNTLPLTSGGVKPDGSVTSVDVCFAKTHPGLARC